MVARTRNPERFIPDVLPWVHEAGNPYFDWFFGGSGVARAALEAFMRRRSAEVAVTRLCLLLEGKRTIGGFIALSGAELARARSADTLAALKAVGETERAGLCERIAAAKGLFPHVDPEDFYLSKMGVVPDRRRMGLGRALVEEYLAQGRAEGFGRFRLDVCADNVPAVQLYRSGGFRVSRRTACAGMRYLAMTLEA